ncbi:MAG TPA: hypothetical protein VF492_10365, partial [Verrucomicrobiae bacterium]
MKRWKIQLIVTGILCLLVAIFAFVMYQRIIATSPAPSIVDAKVDSLANSCGMLFGAGMILIWALPFLRKF